MIHSELETTGPEIFVGRWTSSSTHYSNPVFVAILLSWTPFSDRNLREEFVAKTLRFIVAGLFLFSVMLLRAEQPSDRRAVAITLGRSAVPLYGPWKFTVGDSPTDPKSGMPLWAEQDFDDSGWEDTDLTPQEGSLDPNAGIAGYVPGWTARGHPGYWGYAWYRIRVRVNAAALQGLALEGPADADDGYQVFANGAVIGSFGDFTGPKPVVYNMQPAKFLLPPLGNDSTQVISIRFWMEPSSLIQTSDAGGMHAAPLLGERDAIALHDESRWVELVRTYLFTSIETVLLGLLSVVTFSLIFFYRSDRAYLWMGALFLTTAAYRGGGILADLTTTLSMNVTNLLVNDILFTLSCGLCIMVWWVWFGRRGPRWIPQLTAGLTALVMISDTLADEGFYGIISHQAALRLNTLSTVIRILLCGLLVRIAVDGIRHRGLDGWLFVPILFLRGVAWFWLEIIALFHIRLYYYPYGVWVSPGLIARLLEALLISFLLLRRLLQSVKRQREMALDVKQAQEVQQVILPEHRIVLNGFAIESEYRPAREVGGDFFQVVPRDRDGSLLIVAGDVAGKGLQAGMLVALLVGAIRTAAESDPDPESVLATLNRRVLGRGDVRATCLALRIERDGAVALANAGHLPPYLNGALLDVEGSLPLGTMDQCDCSVSKFRMAENDYLLLVSDGVVEATDQNGELFGFERALELVRTRPSSARIAEVAQAFGQEDDISVISVTRMPVAEPAMG